MAQTKNTEIAALNSRRNELIGLLRSAEGSRNPHIMPIEIDRIRGAIGDCNSKIAAAARRPDPKNKQAW